MEDLLPILVSAIVVIAAIANGISETKKKAQKKSPTTPDGEAWPTWKEVFTPDEHPVPTTVPEAAQRRPEPNRDLAIEGESSVRKIEPRMPKHAPQANSVDIKPRSIYTTKPAAGDKQEAKNAPDPKKTANNEVSSDLIEDFDLRKAVIYSEIIKPKFDEE